MIFVADPDSAFTLREQQILYYIAGGLSNKEIAGRLSLSEQTVKAHLSHMTTKCGRANRAARRAVRTAALRGHVGQMRLHRLLGEGKPPGDLLVRETAGDVVENLLLAQGECRIGVGDEDHRMSLTSRP